MSIVSIGSSTSLIRDLESKGLSERAAKLVDSDLTASIASATTSSGKKPDIAAVRAVLDKKIAADVASGKLSKEDAATVTKALDDMQQQAKGGAAPAGGGAPKGAAKGGGGGAGGGGGGSSSEKTELSRVVVISGSLKTTTITYTDGTTQTETSVNTGPDPKTAKTAEAGQAADPSAGAYAVDVQPGSIVDLTA